MRHVGVPVVGCDLSPRLLGAAAVEGPVVRCRLPDLGWLRDDSVAGAYAVLVLEHIAEMDRFFAESHRVVETGGSLTVIANHPAYTPPGAGPVIDPADGEVLWRWADYFTPAVGLEPAGAGRMAFHHRPLGAIVAAARAAGWLLEFLEERPITVEPGDATLAGQDRIPRLIGLRWLK